MAPPDRLDHKTNPLIGLLQGRGIFIGKSSMIGPQPAATGFKAAMVKPKELAGAILPTQVSAPVRKMLYDADSSPDKVAKVSWGTLVF